MKALEIVNRILAEADDKNQEKIVLNVLMAVAHISYSKAKKLEMKLSNKNKIGVSSTEVIDTLKTFKPHNECLTYKQPIDINTAVVAAAFQLYMQGLVIFNESDIENGVIPTPHGILIATQLLIEDDVLNGQECPLAEDYKQAEAEQQQMRNN